MSKEENISKKEATPVLVIAWKIGARNYWLEENHVLGGLKKILNTELAKAKTSHTMSKEVGGHHLLPGHCRVVIDGLMMKKKEQKYI